MNPQIFRAYDIRGVADRDLHDDLVHRIARAYGTMVRAAVPDRTPRVALGRDCRLSSERLFAAFAAGLRASGVDVADVGVGASPELYWSVFHLDADGGVQITGSHNPAEHNGFKMMLGKSTLHGAAIAELRALVEGGRFAEGAGAVARHDLRAAYVADIARRVSLGPRPPRVVLDAGNGAGGPAGEALVRALGLEATCLHTTMDGRFPNHHPDPTVEENLEEVIAAVRATGADLGIAYDGDADRIGVVDDRGQVLWGDRLLILLARAVLAVHPGAAIVGEVKCSQTLFDDVARHGGRPIMSAVGHSIIKDRMKVEGALLAGEMSGHIFYKERWLGFDDAIYVTARLVEILSHAGRPLSELLADVPTTHVTPEIRLDCPDETKFSVVAQAVEHYREAHPVVDIDGARVDFGDGWGLVRASNTQPVIVLRAEASSADGLQRIRAEIEGFVAARR